MTPADTPPSTGILATVNVSSIGGPPSVLLHDDGTSGDVTPGDNVFSALVTIGAATPSGLKMLPVTVSDAQARTATTKITLTVAGGPTLVISQVYGGGGNAGVVQGGQVVPVRITVGCNGFLGGLQPLISIRTGDYDPNVDPGDPSYEVGETAGSADTDGVMREIGEQYVYNLRVPRAPAGTLFTVLVRPFGGTSPTLHALLRIRR